MSLSIEFLIPKIENSVNEIYQLYKNNVGLILSEDDLKCNLFKKLYEIPEISNFEETKDKSLSANYIHSEIAWFDREGKLKIIPDISIIEPQHLLLQADKDIQLPSKGFIGYLGKSIIFELKFCKQKSGITKNFFEKEILKDFRKINKLYEKLGLDGMQNNVFCFFIVFNKSNLACNEFHSFFRTNSVGNNYKIIYKTIDFEFFKKDINSQPTTLAT